MSCGSWIEGSISNPDHSFPGRLPTEPGIAIRVKKTFILLAVVALCVPPLWAADETPVRVFVLKHKRVEEAALLVRPLLSESASVTLTQKLNAMTVTDRPEKLDQIGKVIRPSTWRRAATRSRSSS